MNFKVVDLGRDWKGPQPIPNLSEARNTFIDNLKDDEYVLFVDSDEEAPKMLLDFLSRLKPQYPCYCTNIFEVATGRVWRKSNLLSNKVKLIRHPHEIAVMRNPYRRLRRDEVGLIDFPVIHNHPIARKSNYEQPLWYTTRAYRLLVVLFRIRDMAREALKS